jgi:hypothetical protein
MNKSESKKKKEILGEKMYSVFHGISGNDIRVIVTNIGVDTIR